MLKSTLIVLALAVFANAQNRPFYASRPVGVPEMLDQFKPTDGLGNRVGGDDDEDKAPLKPEGGIMGDPYLTPRLGDFPREHMPFWYLNSKQIMEHRGQRVPAEKVTEVETPVEADPTERRPTGQRRRPAKLPAKPATPDRDEDVNERVFGGKPEPQRRRPTKIPAKPARFEEEDDDFSERQLGGEPQPQRRPAKAPPRRVRPEQNWQFNGRQGEDRQA